jgi:type IV pilus assembly protein PilB
MMADETQQRRPLGAILLESGRITQADVERVLEYQRSHGGYFGQGLVSLGILSREETDWALANHFDLPFIFPHADAVDRDVAHLVPADWALAHMAVPIVRAGRLVTVVVAEPLTHEVTEELRKRTGLQVEMALASAARIRELIHAIYDTRDEALTIRDRERGAGDFVARALSHAAERFGISIRGPKATGWWRARGRTHRAPLAEGWEAALDAAVHPAPVARVRAEQDGHIEWEAEVDHAGLRLPLEAQALVGAGGAELMFTPLQNAPLAPAAAELVLPTTLMTELRLLWRSGSARIAVQAERPEAARALLPLIPSIAVGEQVRALHVNTTGEGGMVYTLRGEQNDAFAETVATYELDAITIDLPAEGYPLHGLLRAAPLALVLLQEALDESPTKDWGVNWLLTISGEPGGFTWQLRALHR